jgi:hypothetical protein
MAPSKQMAQVIGPLPSEKQIIIASFSRQNFPPKNSKKQIALTNI